MTQFLCVEFMHCIYTTIILIKKSGAKHVKNVKSVAYYFFVYVLRFLRESTPFAPCRLSCFQ